MKDFRFSVFDNKSKLIKQRWNDAITTKKMCICFFKEFFLWNEKSIVNERKKRDSDIEIFWSFLKNVKDEWNIKSWKNKRKSRTLSYTYIYIEERGNKIIPQILSLFTNWIIRKEWENFRIETSFVQSYRKKLIIERWEKLSDIKYQNAHLKTFNPFWANEMSKKNSYIHSQALFQLSKLVQMYEVCWNWLELKSFANNLFD